MKHIKDSNNTIEWIEDIFLSFYETSTVIEGYYLNEVGSDNVQILYFFNKDKFCKESICRIILDISYKDYEINITSTYTFMLNPKLLRDQNINLEYAGANTYGKTLNIDYIEDESDKDEIEWKIEEYATCIINDINEKIEKIKPRIDNIVSEFNEVMSDRDYVVVDSINDDDISDSISYVEQSSSSAPDRISGKYYQLKINETGEILDVYENNREIVLRLADKSKKIPCNNVIDVHLDNLVGLIKFSGKELERLAVNSNYQGYKLGDFLVKKAVEEHGCERVVCNGTRAYKLYRKYGFVPIIKDYHSKEELDEDGGLFRVIELYQKDKLSPEKYQQWYVDYCDNYYKGQIDSKLKKENNMKDFKLFKNILSVGDLVKLKNGLQGIVEDYDDKYFYIRDTNANTVKIVKDGVWALPFTKEKAQKLYDLVCTNKYDGEDKMKILYGLYGSDKLFDDLYDNRLETTVFNPGVVKMYLRRELKLYKEEPDLYRVKMEAEAKPILERIVNE